jgi:hypothetical protein
MEAPRLTPAQEMRVLVGFAAQPFVAAMAAFAIAPIVEYTGRWFYSGWSVDPAGVAVSLAAGAGLAAVFVIPLAALPAFAWLLTCGKLTQGRVLVSGALLGNVPYAAILALVAVQALVRGDTLDLSRFTYGWLGLIRAIALGAIVGTVSASVFWLIVRRHLPAEPADGVSAL